MMQAIGLLGVSVHTLMCGLWRLVIKWETDQEISAQLRACVWCIISILGAHIVSWLFIFDKSSGFLHYVTSGGGGDVDDGAFSQSEPRLVTNRLKSTNKCLPKFLALKICQTHGNLISRRSDTILIGHFIDILSVRCLPSSFLNLILLPWYRWVLGPESGQISPPISARPQVTAKPYSIVLAPIFVITQSGSYFTGNICLYLFSFHIHLSTYRFVLLYQIRHPLPQRLFVVHTPYFHYVIN